MPAVSIGEEPVFIVKSAKSGVNDPEFAKLLNEAKAAQKKANSVGGEWRDVDKMLKESEKAAKEGDMKKAKELAAKAKSQSEMGYEQMMAQKGNVRHPSFLK
jgi:C4-type Zn-finger protein